MLGWFGLVASTVITVWVILDFPIPRHPPRLPDPPRWLETYTQERRRCHRKCLASIAQLEAELGFDSDPLGPISDKPGQAIPEYSIGTSRWARPDLSGAKPHISFEGE